MAAYNVILKAGSVCVGLKADDAATWASSVTQHGITWTFSTARPVGQFVNGDYWVVGPVTINSVSPAPSGAGAQAIHFNQCLWNGTNRTVTAETPGAAPFAEYNFTDTDDYVVVSAQGGANAGTYQIAAKNSDDQIVLAVGSDLGSPSAVVGDIYHPADGSGWKINGSMLNPDVADEQGYDGRIYAYDTDISVDFPLTLSAGDSLISTESVGAFVEGGMTNVAGAQVNTIAIRQYVKRAAVLTCLASAPSATAFRPTYTNNTKTIFDFATVDISGLPSLTPVDDDAVLAETDLEEGQNRCNQYAQMLTPVHLYHMASSAAEGSKPILNEWGYYREAHGFISEAALLLCGDYPADDKEALAIAMIQIGIDEYYGTLNESEMDRTICKFPSLFAGMMLDNAAMKAVSNPYLKLDNDTYTGTGWHGQTALFRQSGSSDYQYEEVDPLSIAATTTGSIDSGSLTLTVANATGFEVDKVACVDGAGNGTRDFFGKIANVSGTTITLLGNSVYATAGHSVSGVTVRVFDNDWCDLLPSGTTAWKNDSYRRSTHSFPWVGMALAGQLITGMKAAWAHDPFFDYMDRYMDEDESSYYTDLHEFGVQAPCDGGADLWPQARGNLGWNPGQTSFDLSMWEAYR